MRRPTTRMIFGLALLNIVPAGCTDTRPAPGGRAVVDERPRILREALAHHIREYEALQRRAGGLPKVVFVGTVKAGGGEPIGDLDPGLFVGLHSDDFTIRQASGSEIRMTGPGPNFVTDKISNERGIRMLVAPPEPSGDRATAGIFTGMSSYDGIGGEFRLTLERRDGAWKVVRSERIGGMP